MGACAGAARGAPLLAGGIVAAVSAAAARNAYAYFGPLQRGGKIRSVYPYQIDAAARAVARLPAGTTALPVQRPLGRALRDHPMARTPGKRWSTARASSPPVSRPRAALDLTAAGRAQAPSSCSATTSARPMSCAGATQTRW